MKVKEISKEERLRELKMLQSLPLPVKIEKSKKRIKEFVEQIGKDDVYISFSGGKDSTVLLHLVRSMYPNIKAVFSDTGLEYPEIRDFVKTFDNVEIVKPLMNFRDVILTHGYPLVSKEVAQVIEEYKRYDGTKYIYRKKRLEGTLLDKNGKKSAYCCEKYLPLAKAPFKISSKCCNELKKKPLTPYKNSIVGTMAQESRARATAWLKSGCNQFDKKVQSKPLSFWTEQDILHYITLHSLDICTVYGDIEQQGCKLGLTGCPRTGCIFCAFGAHLEKGVSRYERLNITHHAQYNYCINGGEFNDQGIWQPSKEGLGLGFVFDWCNENLKNFEIRY